MPRPVGPHLLLGLGRRAKVVLSASLVLVLCFTYPAMAQDRTLATFYGAYQRIKTTSRTDGGLNLELNFKTSEPDGLLLVARLDRSRSNVGYLGVGVQNRHIVAILADSTDPVSTTTSENVIQAENWYHMSLAVEGTVFSVNIDRRENFTFSSSLELSLSVVVRDVFLGGANNFFGGAFSTLEITEYFVGCLANCSINGRDVNFAPKVPGYGMEYGCCPNPEPISWNFAHRHANALVFDAKLSHQRFQSDTLVISFRIQVQHGGMIFYTDDDSNSQHHFALAVELYNGQLVIHATNEGDPLNNYSLVCGGSTMVNGWNHEVSISVSRSSLSCVVDVSEMSMNISLPLLPSSSIRYHVGSANLTTESTSLHLFHSDVHTLPSDGVFPSFGGSLQKFSLNGLEAAPSSLDETTPSLSSACPEVPDDPPGCQLVREELSLTQLLAVTVSSTVVPVDEESSVRLTSETIAINIPDDITRSNIREAILELLRFTVNTRPQHGSLVNSSSPREPITQFTHANLQTGEIEYHHHGEEIPSDYLILNITSVCFPAINLKLTVNFSVELTNDPPVVTQLGTLAIAVGTRQVVSSNVISVEDEETPNLVSLSFKVLRIHVDECGGASICRPAGRIERPSGFNSTHFNQQEINNGEVLFQHYPEFGTQTLTINLRVSDAHGNGRVVDIPVVPHDGHVTLVVNKPLDTVGGRCVHITSTHLDARTDFDQQNPILQYNVTTAPRHGQLQVQDQSNWRPVLEDNVDFDDFTNFKGFTQDDVNRNYVRYCHDNNSLETDSFEFQLNSTLLIGERGNFTINVFSYSNLPKPNVTIETAPLRLTEGGNRTFSVESLNVSLTQEIVIPWSSEIIQIQNFSFFFRIELLPLHGTIYVDNEELTADGFSLAQLVRGEVEYRHDNSENHEDLVSIHVEARNAENLPLQYPDLPPVTNVTISVAPVNDDTPVVQTSRITVAEGRFVMLSPEILNITDDDRPPETVTVTIIQQDLNHGYFALRNSNSPLNRFTTDDIISEQIYFQQKLNVSLNLTHTITVALTDGQHTSQKDVVIEAVPLVIDINEVNMGECIVELDAENERLNARVSHNFFRDIRIRDEHGFDGNRLEIMMLRVTRQPVYGDWLLGNTSAGTFMLKDLEDGLVTYHFRNRMNRNHTDWIAIEIHYGHSIPVVMTLKICINPVAAPNRTGEVTRSIILAGDASILIDNETFNEVDTRGRGGDAIRYVITQSPQHGRVLDQNNTVLTRFTQGDVDRDIVSYQHVNQSSSTLEDSFLVKICTPYVCRGTYNIAVTFSVTNLTVHNNGLRVKEGGTIVITKSNLDAIAPGSGIRIHLINEPSKGKIYLLSGGGNYTNPPFFDIQDIARGDVNYTHDGSETLHDSFNFRVSHDTESVSGTFNIEIIPINNNLPLLTRKEFVMIARTTRNITSNDLEAYDEDSNIHSRSLRYSVFSDPTKGYIHFRNETNLTSSLQEWTEDDVRMNRLAYTHTDPIHLNGEDLDIIGINLYDRDQSHVYFIEIRILEIQLTVTSRGPVPFVVKEGANRTISSNFLNAVANGDDKLGDSDLKFNVTLPPSHGVLLLNGRPVTNFTKADIANSGLVYLHDHSNTESDFFKFNITIARHDTSKSGDFYLTIDPVDDDPPVLEFLKQPLFVVEDSGILISGDQFRVIDTDTDMNSNIQTSKINFNIVSGPTNGRVLRKTNKVFRQTLLFTLYDVRLGAVRYESYPKPVDWYDWFIVSLNDTENVQQTLYNFTFVILPNTIPVSAKSFRVDEGKSAIVPNDTIVIHHPYLSTQVGRIHIRESPSNGSFMNVETGEENLLSFTTDDLMANRIKYHHNDAENDKDRVRFIYEAQSPLTPDNQTSPGSYPGQFLRTSAKVSLDILINTRNDRGPEVRTDPNTTLRMWSTDCAFLSTRHLDVFDADTPDSKLTYTFNFTSIDAYISEINNTNNDPIQTFTQEDVANSLIKLFHRNGTRGEMSYTVTDSQYSVERKLVIETDQLEIVVLRNNPLSVAMNGQVAITPHVLDVSMSDVNSTISRCFPNETVWYHFEAKYGIIIVNGTTNATSFTDRDVKAGHVIYQHTRPDIWESLETLTLRARATLTKFKEFELNITIDLPSEPNSPLAVHKNLSVIEGQKTCLSESVLDARNIRYNAIKETVNNTLTSWFVFFFDDSHGEILLDGGKPPGNPPEVTQDQIALGSVCYHHLGAENTSDTITFYVVIRDSESFMWNRTNQLSLHVSVTLVNDESPIVSSSSLVMPVVEGFYSLVTNNSLLVVDEDNPASDLYYTVINLPTSGNLWLDETKLAERDSFSQVDVNEGRLRFKALDVGEWTALLDFTDGRFSNRTNFTISVEEHFIKIVKTGTLVYLQNENGASLSVDHIATRTNGDDKDTVYTVVEYPVNGELKGLEGNKNFTHKDLLSQIISYVPINFRAHSDSFVINVTNREAEMQSVKMNVRVKVWGEVKQNGTVDFDSEPYGSLSRSLPKNILQLSDLQIFMQRPPVIQILQQPQLGFIEVKYPDTLRKRRSTAVTPSNRFTYDFLSYDWVYYTWNASNTTFDDHGSGINDFFTVLVEGYESLQPGEANITIHIMNPPVSITLPDTPTNPPSVSETPTVSVKPTDDANDEGFTLFALIPIVGVIVCLVVIILGVVIFCVTQQGRIRKKLQPKMPRSRPLTHIPLHTYPASYDLDPGIHGEAMTSLNDGMEYRDSHSPLSARHSPLTRYSPLTSSHPPSSAVYPLTSDRYHHLHRHMVPRPRSRRSNVSVSYSHHRPLSEVTLDDIPRGRQLVYSPPPPLAVGVHNPLRPSTRNSSIYDEGEQESGYLSTPNPSIAADEPVRLVLRRPAVEEVSPLPRDNPANEAERDDGEEEVEEVEHEPHSRVGDEGEGDIAEREEIHSDPATNLHEDNGQNSKEKEDDEEAAETNPEQREEESRDFDSNEAHTDSTPPPDQHLPLLPPSPVGPGSPATASNGLHHAHPSPSDLQTLFRTHNPVLKATEYWV